MAASVKQQKELPGRLIFSINKLRGIFRANDQTIEQLSVISDAKSSLASNV